MVASTPVATNVFVPNHAATGGLLAGFSRNPKAFAYNRYSQIFPVPKMLGYYATWTSRQAARIHNTDLRDFIWRDGNDAPTGVDNLESFSYVLYESNRYAFPFTLGDLTIGQADWPVLQAHSEVVAQQAMTGRTALGFSQWGNITATTPWGTHCANVDGAGGATANGNAAILPSGRNFTNGSATQPNVQIALNYGTKFINIDTLAALGMRDTALVMNPNMAMTTAQSPEIHAYFQGSPFAQAQIRGDQPSLNEKWGLPDIIYGHPFIVEDAVIDTNLRGSSPDNPGYVVPDGTALLTSRVGGLEGVGGSPAHSTIVTFYFQDDMTVQSYHDQNNELTRGRVKTNFVVKVVQFYAGFLFGRIAG
jgi:hypothetical protein